jgi:hypothetical protein
MLFMNFEIASAAKLLLDALQFLPPAPLQLRIPEDRLQL